jgi:hypothetical protein
LPHPGGHLDRDVVLAAGNRGDALRVRFDEAAHLGEVARADRRVELGTFPQKLDVGHEAGPTGKAVLAGEIALGVGETVGRVGGPGRLDEFFGLRPELI